MKRIDAVRALAELTQPTDLFLGSVGALRNDWWNCRPGAADGVHNTFSPAILGSVTPTALGLALARPDRRVVAIDTDGSMLLNTGILCALGRERPGNLTVIVLDNGLYECGGALPTHTSTGADLAGMASAAGCVNCGTVRNVDELRLQAGRLLEDGAFGLLVAKIEPGVEQWPPERRRPFDGIEDKYAFRRYVLAT